MGGPPSEDRVPQIVVISRDREVPPTRHTSAIFNSNEIPPAPPAYSSGFAVYLFLGAKGVRRRMVFESSTIRNDCVVPSAVIERRVLSFASNAHLPGLK